MSDYTAILARALVAAGHEVCVWCGGRAAGQDADPSGIDVHRVAGRFGPAGLGRVDRELGRFAGPRTILIQYVPHAYGWKAMNLPFVAWAASRARRGDDVRVMFHEVAYPWGRGPMRHKLLAAVNRAMAMTLIRSCTTAYVSIPSWEVDLRRLGGRRVPIIWAPVPANVPTDPLPVRVAEARARLTGGEPSAKVIGHFGTYSLPITSTLVPTLATILDRRPDARAILLGPGGERCRDDLVAAGPHRSPRVVATGRLPAHVVAEYLAACDLMIQPYPDGASTRRGSLMASLANEVPVLTTIGLRSEPIWSDGSVATAPADRLAEAALELLDRPAVLRELARAGRRLYAGRFAIERTVAILTQGDPLEQEAAPTTVGPRGILS